MGLHRRRLRLPAIGLAAVLLAGGGTAYAVTSGETVPRYRTVAAANGDVEQTLASTGTVDATNRADLGFGTGGTIGKLRVAVGDTVKVGQVLAVLKTTELDAAVTEAKSSLAQAVAQLASDRAAQSSSVSDAVSDPKTPTTPANPEKPTDSATTAATLKAPKQLQDKVISAQSAASAALAAAKTALTTQTAACADAYVPPVTADAEEGADVDADADAAAAAATAAAEACTTALAAVQDRQGEVSDAQDVLAQALTDLSAALTKALGDLGSSSSGGSGSGGSGQGSGQGSTSNARTTATDSTPDASSSSGSGGTTITAARLASDQAQIEQAKADLVTAEQARSSAKLRSTRSGRVAALGAGVGDTVAAGDTVVTVIGGKAVTISGTVAEDKVDQVEVGQKVRVTMPGSSKTTTGIVTAIGMVADTTSGSTLYPVTVSVENPEIPLPTGSQAALTIILSVAKDVVTLPTSAIVRQGDAAVVKVWNGKALSTKQVVLGAVGSNTVAISSGVSAGTTVVLAAIDDPISGASSTLNERGGFGGGPMIAFSGGGAGGGGPRNFTSTR